MHVYDNRFSSGSYIKTLTVKTMVLKHPNIGSMFVYNDYSAYDRSTFAVAWTADRRANWFMRLRNNFASADQAFAWLREHVNKYQPDPTFVGSYGKKRTPRDSQRKKVYRWENDMAGGIRYLTERLSKEETLAFVNEIYETIGVPEKARPTIWLRRGNTAYYWFQRHILKLPVWARNRFTIIHEIAHNVMDWAYGVNELATHGAHFVKTYLELLFLVTQGTEEKYILDTCREHGVKYKEPDYSTFDEQKFQSSIRGWMSRN